MSNPIPMPRPTGMQRNSQPRFSEETMTTPNQRGFSELPPSLDSDGGLAAEGKQSVESNFLRLGFEYKLPGHERGRSSNDGTDYVAMKRMSTGSALSTERESVVNATFTKLASMQEKHGALLNDPGEEGQKLRRRLLRGACIVFFTAGYTGKRFIYERAQALGVVSILIDGPDSWAKTLETEGVIAKFVGLDMADEATIVQRALEGAKAAAADLNVAIDGVVTFCEVAVPVVARMALELQLPGNTPGAIDVARDKHRTRAAMAAFGMPTPAFSMITSDADLESGSKTVGFPAILKPINGAASIGVMRVDQAEDLEPCYARVMRDLKTTVVSSGAIVMAADGNEAVEPGFTDVLMEEYLDGQEVDVDVVLSQGEASYINVTDNWPCQEPWFNETGDNCPSLLPPEQQKELVTMALDACAACGLTTGVFHVEGKYTSRGPRLIEVNSRMGGGFVRDHNLWATGVDLVEEHLFAGVGVPARKCAPPEPLRCLAGVNCNAPKTGVMGPGWGELVSALQTDNDDVLDAHPLVSQGSKVVCTHDGLPTWIAEVTCVGPTAAAAKQRAEELRDTLIAAAPIA